MTDTNTEATRVTLTEQDLFDRLVTLFGEQLVLAEDIKQLKKDAKFHKEHNPQGIAKEDISFVVAAAKLEAKQQYEEFSGKAFAVSETYKRLTKYND